MKRWISLIAPAPALSVAFPAPGAEPTTEAMRLLKTNCFSCHNGEKKKGGLVMTSREDLLKGGDNGAALDLNAPDTRNFSRSYRRHPPAEVLADAVADITGVPNTYAGMPPGSRAIQAWTYKIDSPTMDAFNRPNSSSDCPLRTRRAPEHCASAAPHELAPAPGKAR
jgi:hypothetical protein